MVEETVANCLPWQAATHTPATQDPLNISPYHLDHPWKEVSVDFCDPFSTGECLLVIIDDFSRFPEVEIIHSTSSNVVISNFDATFARLGILEVVKTDNGPPFSREILTSWTKMVGFHHRKVSPLWQRANGEAERFMPTIEKAVCTAMLDRGSWKQELFKFLRHYRANPHGTTGTSPAEMLYTRK